MNSSKKKTKTKMNQKSKRVKISFNNKTNTKSLVLFDILPFYNIQNHNLWEALLLESLSPSRGRVREGLECFMVEDEVVLMIEEEEEEEGLGGMVGRVEEEVELVDGGDSLKGSLGKLREVPELEEEEAEEDWFDPLSITETTLYLAPPIRTIRMPRPFMKGTGVEKYTVDRRIINTCFTLAAIQRVRGDVT